MSRSTPSSTTTATKRLMHELHSYTTSPNPHLAYLAPTHDDSLFTWSATMHGPRGTAYANALFPLTLTILPTYPLTPPKIHFSGGSANKIPVHANVHPKTGEICLDLLTSAAWSPAYTISETLSAVYRLLAEGGNAESPLDVDVGVLMRMGDGVAVEALVRWGVWKGMRDE